LKLKDWLGGLDSNQDSQSQSLESYQLDDLPGVANKVVSVLDGLMIARFFLNFHRIVDDEISIAFVFGPFNLGSRW
jgi:hypothetical protein